MALAAEGLQVELAVLSGGADVVAQAGTVGAEVVLLDLDLGVDRSSGEALVPGLTALGAKVVVVSAATDPLRLGTCLELGAAGVLSKSRPFEDVLTAVLAASAGQPVMRDDERQELLARMRKARAADRDRLAPFERLTPREAEVLALLMQGCNADAIAKQFVVSEATVRTQVRGVLTKLAVTSQLAAVAEAFRVGWAPR